MRIVDSYQAEFLAQHTDQVVTQGPAYTYEVDGQPVLAGGICPYWPGVGLAWMIAAERVRQTPLRLGLIARKVFLTKLLSDFWRVEALARLDRPESGRFLLSLGFRPECLASQYGPDRGHYVRYVWLRRHE